MLYIFYDVHSTRITYKNVISLCQYSFLSSETYTKKDILSRRNETR